MLTDLARLKIDIGEGHRTVKDEREVLLWLKSGMLIQWQNTRTGTAHLESAY